MIRFTVTLDFSPEPTPEDPFIFNFEITNTISSLFYELSEKYELPSDFEITLKVNGEKKHTLNHLKEKTLSEVLWPILDEDEYELVISLLKIKNMSLCVSDVSEDELFLGASASPTAGELALSEYPSTQFEESTYDSRRRKARQLSPVIAESPTYVGLVNQAMTCYLNSLLQALYMTPEFRNALYNWEFDGANETRSIPYQLQKLFLNLQTSNKSAVETTDLTTSFGWQGSEAWHQHDIQELCRVMFDALEHKFKDTKQANLINDLYEGKMLDYVKCLECGIEKSREDTFLDIPLPVRPFGCTVAYNSVEEALRAFVQPETLEGNNQYFCEKCNKKCDAHKGLKFTKFPYLLTLHLKRFDFDYNSMHRIKLNDKVVFPEKLNLNSFVPPSKSETEHTNMGDGDAAVKCDDCSTTDSGAADDESCQGTDLSSAANGQDDNCADACSDEGIDVSSGNNQNEPEAKGPYVYELFSIMIHSGSASGGHYYAYIKDFDKNSWFCFNDQTVSPITEDDIKKTYGGGPQRGYSGAYSSSTNAYMLMYRQIDKDRNCRAISVNEFPPHIESLLTNIRQKEEEERLNRKKEDEMVKLNITCIHPTTGVSMELKISTFSDEKLGEIAQHAYIRFKLDGLVEIRDCRLVAYNKQQKCIYCSFQSDEVTIRAAMLMHLTVHYTDWMLEIKEPGTKWKQYQIGGINMRVFPINLETEDIEEPTTIRVEVGETVGQLKQELGQLLMADPLHLKVMLGMFSNEAKYFDDDSEVVHFDSKGFDCKIYVGKDTEMAKKNVNKLKKLVDLYSYITSITISMPNTDEDTLETLSIPPLDINQNVEKQEPINDRPNSPSLRASPQPITGGMCGDGYDQSNSEDSSLSDGDRTLIGDAPVDCMALSSNSPSPGDQHMASPDPCQGSYNCDVMGRPDDEMYWDDTENQLVSQKDIPQNLYFRVAGMLFDSDPKTEEETYCHAKVLVDRRMTLETLKKHLEQVLKVPSEYFKVFRHQHLDEEWVRLKDTLRCLKDDERLTIKLGRVLKEDEHQCKVYYLKQDNMEPNNLLFEHIIAKNQVVESVKKDILHHAKKRHNLDIPYNRCRLREKSWKKPKKVYLDDQKFGDDISLPYNFELYLQELTEPESVTSNNQVVVFLRRFHPAELTLGPFQEAVLDLLTMDDLKTKVSEISQIPLEHLGVAKVKCNYPYDMHILEIEDDLDWNPDVQTLDQWPLSVEDGCMFFYKDNREKRKDLTLEEKKEIRQKEDARLGRLSVRTYSPGRERALKIYLLDSSPAKIQDDIDSHE
ncbi:ubiquitin carboxyl-terminal hydrolase 47, partial [Anthonomus grandis grandis]|uniref:ubiquitin carboxyl-terminal hydrolase 47 n=1 Tax=Anthonomus grandis grandis TaxID=2921223 RepID=UPI002165EF61